MKSKRAKEHIDELSSRHGLSVYEVDQAVALAEEDAKERAAKEFEKAKERIKAAIRLTFNGCLSSQLLERRILIFEDLISEINIGEQSNE